MDIAQIILQTGLINKEQLAQALEFQKETGSNLVYIICKMRFVNEDEFAATLAKQSGQQMQKLDAFTPDMDIVGKFPQEFLETNLVLPLKQERGALTVGVASPCSEDFLDELRLIAADKIETVLVPALKLNDCLKRCFGGGDDAEANKVKVPHRHHSARETLTELVHELEDQAKSRMPAIEPKLQGGELYTLETRELVFALIRVLENQGILTAQDILEAGSGANDA